MSKKLFSSLLVVIAFVIIGAGNAQAETITLTMGGVSFIAAGDTVKLLPNIINLSLTAGAPLTANVQPGDFIVGDSGGVSQVFPLTLSRSAAINGITMTASQAGQLAILPGVDTLTLFGSPTLTYDLGPRGVVDVTLRGVTMSANDFGTFTFTVRGNFLLRNAAAVPEPTTMLLLGTGLAGVGAATRRRRKVQKSG